MRRKDINLIPEDSSGRNTEELFPGNSLPLPAGQSTHSRESGLCSHSEIIWNPKNQPTRIRYRNGQLCPHLRNLWVGHSCSTAFPCLKRGGRRPRVPILPEVHLLTPHWPVYRIESGHNSCPLRVSSDFAPVVSHFRKAFWCLSFRRSFVTMHGN